MVRNLCGLMTAIAGQARSHAATLCPGFTHLQIAQPVTFGRWFMAHGQAIHRNVSRLWDWDRRAARSPLGAAALAGSAIARTPCLGLNGGTAFKQTEAFSFQIATDDQAETDRYWNAIVGNDGHESACGWCKDKWGVSWQITPRVLTEALAAVGDKAKRAFDAMMTMKKIDVAMIEAAVKNH